MVDVKEECSFIFPSIVRDGPVVVGISTGGMSPVIARYLKARIRSVMPDSLGELTTRLGAYRETIKTCSLTRPGSAQPCFTSWRRKGSAITAVSHRNRRKS